MLRPSRRTVHAPQFVVSHPMTVPVLPTCSRRYCTSRVRFSTSSEYSTPSTVTLIRVIPGLPLHSRRRIGHPTGRGDLVQRGALALDNRAVTCDTRPMGP